MAEKMIKKGDKEKVIKKKVAVAHIQVIEFQKRWYPHDYIIIHLANEDKLQDGDDVDQLYVAPSRAREFENVLIKCKATNHQGILQQNLYTDNVVYKEVLLGN